ncbi:MAG: undecaprenyl/decaprenyl-phosphate alpha-N-acetylglucosaminyl 1-phosphate transferase [Ignavibacteriota bacterium]|nr:MAG: undecaprenyl/decaprenyl-phosphate alpha-N-acetylglucosaminyl 1-phosphate transferase [Chlorobiota bacterium]MBE7477826.1 undecaprenyl/decaprenyl-phosphate alpha-N-acetylglucosaminyl 1-phosphate transferase [Ignavibacteriales bacterium]MCC7094138.1 undecaprenyl/decaprenyl-phosphate alpha-N-acetylglucosaminyl 1-phosphate transferase [Ignavibacteriaceae bacterium]MCE7857173.1 undecaprenyl/decaprenyl-phosphate alpha-N-acetylglucosaminyl 1-phosphate transferase [Ignavibacteria bacterium CHB3]
MQYLIIFFATLVSTIFLTPYIIDLFNRIKIVDLPDGKRKLHSVPIPRMGGLLIFLIFLTSIFVFYGDINAIKYYLFGTIIIFALGAYDDLLGTGWLLKFIYQTIAAILLVLYLLPKFSSITLFTIEFSNIPGIILLLFFIVGTINAFNLLDGLDGLVAGISMLTFIVLFFISLNLMDIFSLVILSSIAGCVMGFLKYNTFPAKIFLGDSGSFLLGFLVVSAVLNVSINNTTGILDLTFPVILLAVPIADTVKVFFIRIVKGKHPFAADRTHIHHIVHSQNITHATTVFIISIYSLLFAGCAIIYLFYSRVWGMALFGVMIFPLFFANKILQFIIQREKLVVFGRAVNRFPQFLINYYKMVVLPLTGLLLLLFFLYLLIGEDGPIAEFLLPSFIIIGILLVFAFVNYRRNKIVTDSIVFFNILIFFIINQTHIVLYEDILHIPVIGNLTYHLLVVSFLLPTVGFFMVFKDRIIQKESSFFTAFDLIIILIIILLSITANLIPVSKSYLIADVIFRSFLIYAFYKVVISIQSSFRFYLFAGSFLFVILSQIIFLMH